MMNERINVINYFLEMKNERDRRKINIAYLIINIHGVFKNYLSRLSS